MSILWSFSSSLQKCQNIIVISTHILCNIHMLTLLYQNFVPLFKKFVVRPQFLVQNKKSVDFNGVLARQEVFCKNRVPFFKKKWYNFFRLKSSENNQFYQIPLLNTAKPCRERLCMAVFGPKLFCIYLLIFSESCIIIEMFLINEIKTNHLFDIHRIINTHIEF